MKFGGTSVGDAECIARTAEIIAQGAREGDCVAVVSAMSGVTNKLIEAASHAQAGNAKEAAQVLTGLREQHEAALKALSEKLAEQNEVREVLEAVLAEGQRLCEGTALLRELTPRTLDAISSLGERLSAPLVSMAIRELGFASEAVTATDLIVTDAYHGGAEPIMELTREKSQARLGPILEKSTVPVVTGFIGATSAGELTTLGRGGSDYSATILGAALDADEVIIWTDVDGVLTADPRLVSEAKTIPEISYREAAELAYFGAKVLHPKTLNPVVQAAIPVWIRNSFQPERKGTKITPKGRSIGGGVKALTAIRDVTLISVGGPGIVGLPDVVGRTFSTTAEVRANVLLISQSSSQNDICFIVSAADAQRTVEAMRKEFAQDLAFGLSHVVHLLHPEVIVLGGGLSLIGEPLCAAGCVPAGSTRRAGSRSRRYAGSPSRRACRRRSAPASWRRRQTSSESGTTRW
jgi:aspartate kinase